MNIKDEATDLLVQHATKVRDTRHGALWRFTSGVTLLVRRDHSKNVDENAYKSVIRDIRRILRQEEESKMAGEKPQGMAQTVVAPNYPGNGAGGGQRLGLSVKTKAKKIVLEELASELVIAPHQIKSLLAREGVPVPDDIKLSAKDGYLVVSWASTRESVEE